jgi:hypothetical protein
MLCPYGSREAPPKQSMRKLQTGTSAAKAELIPMALCRG